MKRTERLAFPTFFSFCGALTLFKNFGKLSVNAYDSLALYSKKSYNDCIIIAFFCKILSFFLL